MSALLTGQLSSGVHGERPRQHDSHRGTQPGCGVPRRDLATVVARRDRKAAARSLRQTLTATWARQVLLPPAQTRPTPQARSSMASRRKSPSRNRRQARRPDHPPPRAPCSATSPACPTSKPDPCVWALRLEGCDVSGDNAHGDLPIGGSAEGLCVPGPMSPTAGLATMKGAARWCEQGQQRHDVVATQTTFRGSRVSRVICAT